MLRLSIALVLVSGCRIAFDPLASDAAPQDTSTDVADRVIPSGPKVWLRMDTDPNGGIVDSGAAHAVRCTNGPCPTLAQGRYDNGFAFNGQQVVVDYRADLDSSAGFSAAIWIELRSVSTTSVTAAWTKTFNTASGFDTFALTIQTTTGQSRFDGESPAGVPLTQYGPVVPTGEWHHLALTYDGTTRRDYFDGAQVMTSNVQIGVGTLPMELGFARNAYYIDAVLDDAVYYTRALTQAEVTQLATP
ncbi:MAG TPA: LamG-like jellyroll fold domain-containing protein [Kofleriaceae bacterium]|nr:LamG-like jellyroll fold domain-containing protein [Kofleriaceae bacterium]